MIKEKKPETALEYIKVSAEYLCKNNIKDARLNAELLLCDVLKCGRMDLYLNFDKPLTKDEVNLFRTFLKRRQSHEPIQYITGKAYFFGYEFKVKRGVLIPRPETEILVEKVIQDILQTGRKDVSIFEIGSGSGCISISIIAELIKENVHADIVSIDISDEALNLCEENSKRILQGNNSVRFMKTDIFRLENLPGKFDYIVSNPPYISSSDYLKLEPEVRQYEPEEALTDGNDGLSFFRRIFGIVSKDKFKGKVFCEIGFMQKDSICNLLNETGFLDYIFYKDYAGIDRILEVRI